MYSFYKMKRKKTKNYCVLLHPSNAIFTVLLYMCCKLSI